MTNGAPPRQEYAGLSLFDRLPDAALYALLGLVSLLIYGQTVGYPLIWDSVGLVVKNPTITAFDPVAAFTTPSTVATESQVGEKVGQLLYYRPVLRIALSAWYAFAGESSALWHGLAVLVNILSVVLAYRLLQAARQPRWAAFAAALLFAVNPGRVAGIASVYGLSDQIFGVFALAGFLCWVRRAPGWTLLFLALALGSRETAVLFPILVLCWELLFRKQDRAWGWLLAQAGLVGAYLIVRYLVVGPAELTSATPVQWLNSVAVIVSSHVHSLVWPGWGAREYPLEDFSAFSPRVLISYAVLAGGLAALVWGLRRNRWVAFWLLWFGVWLSIHFNVGRFGEFLLAEKNNYILALAFAVLLAGAARLAGRYALVLCAVVAVAQGGLGAWRVTHWRDPVIFFNSAIENAPRYATLHYNLALAYVDRQDFGKAEQSFLRTIELVPGHSMAWNNLGNIRFMRQDIAGAAQAWQTAFDADPGNMMAAHNLSLAYSRLGDKEAAAKYFALYQKLRAAQTAAGR